MPRFNVKDLPDRHRGGVEAALAAEKPKDLDTPKQRKKPTYPEAELQKEIIRTADGWPMKLLVGPDWPADIRSTMLGEWLYHIPNGGRRSAIEAAIFKAMGVRPGVLDLFLMLPTELTAGLYMELKADDNALTDKQEAFMMRALRVGYLCAEIRSGVEFVRVIERYLIGQAPFVGRTEDWV